MSILNKEYIDFSEALNIVYQLAEQNLIDDTEEDESEAIRQEAALNIVWEYGQRNFGWK